MTDAFISYSRRDQALVRRLNEALAERGKDAWVDWEDIPPTADWFERITDGIREAKAFVFVVSPDSLASQVCAREIEYAAEQGKRMVPLLARPIEPLVPPEAVARHNWIDFTPQADWDVSVGLLVSALETDLEHLGLHTRYQVDATRWNDADRNASLLLRGRELVAAQAWLEAAAAGDPEPTRLQYEFILASRNAAARRTRVVAGAVSLALLVSAVLGVLALLQRNRAEDERQTALSRELAANAFLTLPSDPELSLILARRAAHTKPSAQAEDALRQALLESRVRLAMRGHEDGVNEVAFSSDGRRLVSAGADRTARLWDPKTGRQIAVLRGHQDGLGGASFSDDGQRFVTWAQDSTARVWDAEDGSLVQVLREPADRRITSASLDADGRTATTSVFLHGRIRVWDVETGEIDASLGAPGGYGLGLTPDRRELLGVTGGVARLWSLATGRPRTAFTAPVSAQALPHAAFGLEGEVVALANGRRVDVLERRTGARLGALRGHSDEIGAIATSTDGGRLATGSQDTTARVHDFRSGREVDMTGHAAEVTDVAFNPSGTLLATGSNDGTARLWDATSGRAIAVLRGHRGPVRSVAFSPDGRLVATASADRTVRLWAASSGGASFAPARTARADFVSGLSRNGRFAIATDRVEDFTGTEGESGRVVDLRTGTSAEFTLPPRTSVVPDGISDDGRLLVTADGDEEHAALFDVRRGTAARSLDVPQGVTTASFSHDGGRLALGSWSGVATVWDVASGRRVATLRGHDPGGGADDLGGRYAVHGVDFSPDDRLVVTASDDASARIWEVASGRMTRTLSGHPTKTHPMAQGALASFSPDGERVVTAVAWNDKAKIFSVRSGREVGELAGHRQNVGRATFSPDGRFVLTSAEDARLWDAVSGRELGQTPGDALGFAPGSDTIVTHRGGRLRVLECDICGSLAELEALAARRVTRELTVAERAKYLHETG